MGFEDWSGFDINELKKSQKIQDSSWHNLQCHHNPDVANIHQQLDQYIQFEIKGEKDEYSYLYVSLETLAQVCIEALSEELEMFQNQDKSGQPMGLMNILPMESCSSNYGIGGLNFGMLSI